MFAVNRLKMIIRYKLIYRKLVLKRFLSINTIANRR